MERVEEGVANFIDFQADMRAFVTRFDTNEKNKNELDARRSKIHYTLLTLLIGLVLALFTFVLNRMEPKQMGILAPLFTQSQPKENAGKKAEPAVTSEKQPPEVGGGAWPQ
jgi:hypothetical protein